MDNPLELDAPEDPIDRVKEFARDLAWGAVNNKWGSTFRRSQLEVKHDDDPNKKTTPNWRLYQCIQRKWHFETPSVELLRSFDYISLTQESLIPSTTRRIGPPPRNLILTQKAFLLLERPVNPPEIFISYRHKESSAFALLVEARLKSVDPDISVFIDKAIQKGDDWEERIKKAVCDSDTFICLLGPNYCESDMMLTEIDWAAKSDSRIISVLHNNLSNEGNLPAILKRKQWIKVQQENAEEYEIAILKLLNALGYSTLQSPRPSDANS